MLNGENLTICRVIEKLNNTVCHNTVAMESGDGWFEKKTLLYWLVSLKYFKFDDLLLLELLTNFWKASGKCCSIFASQINLAECI